jgi:signal transduction histidine kinase
VLFLGTTLVFLAGLVWLGWQTLRQDSQLERQRVRTHLESAADQIATELASHLADVEAELERFVVLPTTSLADAMAGFGARLGDDAVVIAFDAEFMQAYPRGRLLYYPILPAADAPYFQPFMATRASDRSAIEALDLDAELDSFRQLLQSDDERVRAQGTLGVARTQARAGALEPAIATYRQLQQPEVLVDGRPAELLARLATVELFDGLSRRAEYVEELDRIEQDLHTGRWQLTRAAYLHYVDEIRRLRRSPSPATSAAPPSPRALALSAAVDTVWRGWQEDGASKEWVAGRGSRLFNDESVFLIWRSAASRLVTLAGGPEFMRRQVVEPNRAALERHGVRIVLEDSDGRLVFGDANADPSLLDVQRTTADTRLPWTLRVINASEGVEEAQSTMRRQFLVAGLAFVTLFVLAGSYFSARAIAREIEAVRLKSDFVAAVSHEFRTPLTLLRQFSDLLAEDRVSSEQERRRYYAALQRGTRRLTRLVEDLLDFGRFEAGSRVFKFERIAARDWLSSVIAEFQDEVRSKGCRVDLVWRGSSSVFMHADASALGRALWNLLDNAVKYSPNSSTVWVSADVEPSSITVRVRDQGVGVPADEQRAIFQKFVRGSTTSSQVIKGTGLGLALVEQIVDAHGGTVDVESAVGEGSTFSIRLPAEVETDAEREEQTWRAS